jgi:hypothetical protein
MAKITEKELTYIAELLSAEQLCAAQYHAAAEATADGTLKERYCDLACRHQKHFEQLYTNLK